MDKLTKKKFVKELCIIDRQKMWRADGFKSLFDYCTHKMGFSEEDAREIFIFAGLILTAQNMKDADPKVQKRIDDLREWRKLTAAANEVSAYVVLPNRTLLQIARTNPRSKEDLEVIRGMGEMRIKSYSRGILKCIGR